MRQLQRVAIFRRLLENVAFGASQLAMALTELLAKTIEDVPGANQQY